jgi:site-specific recombinase XerC
LSAARVTPLSCGNRPGSNRRRKPQRTIGERYDTTAYAMAIKRACEAAFAMPDELRERLGQDNSAEGVAKRRAARKAWRAANVWHPNQLRHSAGTRLRREYGLEGAAAVLGHAKVETTQIYAERHATAAREIAAAVG